MTADAGDAGREDVYPSSLKLGIWCDYGFTLRPDEGIGVVVASLLRGLGARADAPEITLLVSAVDPEVHDELAAYGSGLKLTVLAPRPDAATFLWTWMWRRLGPAKRSVEAAGARLGAQGRRAVAWWRKGVTQKAAVLLLAPVLLPAAALAAPPLVLAQLGRRGLGRARRLGHALQRRRGGGYEAVFAQARAAGCDVWLVPYPGVPSPGDLGAPMVLVVHDLVYRHHPEGFDPTLTRELVEQTQALAVRAAKVVAPSEVVRTLELEGCLGLPRSHTAVVHHAVPAELLEPAAMPPGELARRYNLPPRWFFYPGAFRPYKNHALAIRALELLRSHDDVGLVFTGIRTPPPELARLLAESPVGSRIHCLGSVPRDEVAALYRDAAALVFPTLHEGFGLPVLEAAALGCPVLCSDLPVLHEIGDAFGEAVSFFDPRSAEALAQRMAAVLEARVRLEPALTRARALARQRTWEQVAGEWLELCRGALGVPATSRPPRRRPRA